MSKKLDRDNSIFLRTKNWLVGIENPPKKQAKHSDFLCCQKMAEGKGFEPPEGVSSFNDLANRRLQPLGHPSAGATRSSQSNHQPFVLILHGVCCPFPSGELAGCQIRKYMDPPYSVLRHLAKPRVPASPAKKPYKSLAIRASPWPFWSAAISG